MLPSGSASYNYYNYPERVDTEPAFFSLQDLRDEEEQDSPLLKLDSRVLDMIMEYVPLKDRLLRIRPVCKKLSEAAMQSVKSVEFLRDELDYCDDAKIAFFLSVYGSRVEHMNFDLYRSCSLREYTQWSWRQSVISSVTKCTQLKQLDILICCRHRLRDGDLQVIFKHCTQLEVLRMDASFVNGNCFAKAPVTLRKMELECCQTFNKQAFLSMCVRLFRLESLHVSLLSCLDEQVIKRLGDMKMLSNLSIIADPEERMAPFRLAELRRLPKLHTLCLDGVLMVTDRFLEDFCNLANSPAAKTLQNLSLAFCRNIGSKGVAHLKNLPKLTSLNLDGVHQREISTGVDAIVNMGRLERLFLADGTHIAPRSVIEAVARCPGLRTLDISNNKRLTNKIFAKTLHTSRTFSFAKPLKIITDLKAMWAHLPPYHDGSRVDVIYVGPPNQRYVDSISINTVQTIPRGYLIPDLRRGNRYKMLNPNLNMSAEQLDPESGRSSPEMQDQENTPPDQVPQAFLATEVCYPSYDEMIKRQDAEFAKILSTMQQQTNIAQSFQAMNLLDFDHMMLQSSNLPFSSPPLYGFTDFENSITVGTAGAPGPPADKKSEKILKHCRASRPKRQAQKEKELRRSKEGKASSAPPPPPPPAPKGPSFTDDDFPPL